MVVFARRGGGTAWLLQGGGVAPPGGDGSKMGGIPICLIVVISTLPHSGFFGKVFTSKFCQPLPLSLRAFIAMKTLEKAPADTALVEKSINTIRFLVVDALEKANSGTFTRPTLVQQPTRLHPRVPFLLLPPRPHEALNPNS
ncbi:hypothetical protein Fmac_001677 [Flemingia macrophylla]|uniref:Uncharacterized protein n=1 Tax=Flemingia macrophylla TaxID=520843 RepID=A0ABD1NHS7_9FABA